jgi:catechol 2,3-dioxygenase-like lactoylglutathione lyase family enzyme
MLWTEDLAATIEFYTRVLGFTCDETNDDWGWASLFLDDVGLMLAKPNEHTPYDKIGFTGTFYFATDDVEAMWLKVKDKARVCYDIETFPWGMREFAVYDNNGYMLQFGQEVSE